jgi:ATP-dependent exoDNAse (exonuclease V) beta subunit
MGKPSIYSRKTAWRRQKKRQKKKNQQKDIEISDLQIQLQEFQKAAETAGEKIIAKLNKTCRENENLLKWIDTFSNQVSSQEEEIYNLKLKLYLQPSSSSSSSQPQPPSSSSLQPSPPSFKSMDEYFKYSNQVIFIYYIFF